MPLAGYLSQRSWIQSDDQLKLIVLDQFEEVLTADQADVETKRAFFRELGEALRDPMVWALLAMREEYSAVLDAYRHLVPTRLSNRYRLDLLGREEATTAIAAPAAAVGVTFAPDTVASLLDDLSTVHERTSDGRVVERKVPFIEPLYLQIVCRRLWHKLPEDTDLITPELLDATGVNEVADALEQYLASVVEVAAKEAGETERAVREWLENELVTPQGLRRQVLRGEKETAGMANPLVEGLAHRALLRRDSRGGTEWFEITHDRLAAVVRDSNAKWYNAHLEPFQINAARWSRLLRAGGDASRETIGGGELKHAAAWAKANPDACSDVDRDFLTTSEAAWKPKRQQRLLTLAIVATVVLGVLAFALQQRKDAQEQWKLNQALEVQTAREHSRALLAEATNQRWIYFDNELAVLLALQSHRAAKSSGVLAEMGPWGEQTLRVLLQARPFAFSVRSGEAGILAEREVAIMRSGRLMALQLASNRVRLRTTAPGVPPGRELTLAARLLSASFTPDDRALDLITERGFERYAVDGDRNEPLVRIVTGSPPLDAHCVTDSDRLFIATESGNIEIWDLSDKEPSRVGALRALILESRSDAPISALACSPDGSWLAWGDADGTLGLVDLSEGSGDTLKLVVNDIETWPEPLRTQLYFRRSYLDYRVISIHVLRNQDILFVLYRQGPPRALDLRSGLSAATAAYLLPDDDSAAALRIAQAAGRATRQTANLEYLVGSDITPDGRLVAIGGQRSTVGRWTLDSLTRNADASAPPMAPIDPERPLYAPYEELPGFGGAMRTLRFTVPRTRNGNPSVRAESEDIWLAAADMHGDLRWWSRDGLRRTGHRAYRPETAGVVYALGFLDADGTRLAYGGSQGSGVLAFDPQSGEVSLETGVKLPHYARSLAVSRDFRRMIIATGDVKPVTDRGSVKDRHWARRRYSWLLDPLDHNEGTARPAIPMEQLHHSGQWAAASSRDGDLILTPGWAMVGSGGQQRRALVVARRKRGLPVVQRVTGSSRRYLRDHLFDERAVGNRGRRRQSVSVGGRSARSRKSNPAPGCARRNPVGRHLRGGPAAGRGNHRQYPYLGFGHR
ncbi:MAG: WD40 repeat domain-containing protein [Chromatiaceae bacterium]|nr:WD40 repeat domain-containing protein [Chromatiaceae bacterium]